MSKGPEHTLTWKGIEDAMRNAAGYLEEHKFTRLLVVSRGGLVPGALLSHVLSIKNIAVVCVESYENKSKQSELKISNYPDPEIFNSTETLLVDDITDTGMTMGALSTVYPKALRFALVAKPAGRRYIHGALIDVSQDTWVNFPWEIKSKKGESTFHSESGLPS